MSERSLVEQIKLDERISKMQDAVTQSARALIDAERSFAALAGQAQQLENDREYNAELVGERDAALAQREARWQALEKYLESAVTRWPVTHHNAVHAVKAEMQRLRGAQEQK